MKKIIAICGSNTTNSINRQLLMVVAARLGHLTVEHKDLSSLVLPIYGVDEERTHGIPPDILNLYYELCTAEGFIIASPEHNGMPTVFLKNIIDWLSRVDMDIFKDKPVLLVSASPGQNGGRSGLELLAKLMPRWGAGALGLFSLGNFDKCFDPVTRRITNLREASQLTGALTSFEKNLHAAIKPKLTQTL